MNKIISLLLSILLLVTLMAGCGSAAQPTPAADTSEASLSIVATIFPEYDWIRQLLGDRADQVQLTLLLDSGVDLHSYQPTVEDIVKLSGCDMFVYVGGESDAWVDDALREATNPDMIVVDLLDVLGDTVKEEELVDGMEAEDGEDEEEEPEYDEHVWLSLRNASLLCAVLADRLAELDPEGAQTYAANAEAYIDRLQALDGEYQRTVEAAPVKTLLFGDRFPFRYLADDYGLNYYAAFAGCSAETEASFAIIAFLSGKVDELGLHSILQIESSDGSIARTIRDTTAAKDQQILTLDSLQSVTARDVDNGVTYLAVMEDNLAVLKEALQ